MVWWMPIVEFFGRIALKYGLQFLENKYPGVKPILDKIIHWLQGQAASGNPAAVGALAQHVDKLCSGVACPPNLK